MSSAGVAHASRVSCRASRPAHLAGWNVSCGHPSARRLDLAPSAVPRASSAPSHPLSQPARRRLGHAGRVHYPSEMNISEPFIQRPVATSLLAIGLFVLGIVAYHFLPVAPVPRVDIPSISVSAALPGADPETVASSLAAPLERRISQIASVSEITSTSTLGGTSVAVQFDLERPVDAAARDIQAAINAAASELPINLPNPPTYRKVNPADAPVMIVALRSDTEPGSTIFEYADEILAQRISQVEGVSQVNISGAEKSAVRVEVNPAALASAGLSLEDVRDYLGKINVNLAKGSVDGDRASYTIYSNDQLFTAEQYRGLIIAQKKGVPIRLDSVAQVIDGTESSRVAGWSGIASEKKPTQRAVLLIIFKQPDANVIETVDKIKEVLPQMLKWLPPSVKLNVLDDRTTTIRSSVRDVQFSLLLSISLVVMVIFLFLRRFWPTFIASITVPLALAGTFAVMYLFNFSVDNLSLMAVTISVGFVVDDAIVVIENVYRFIEKGERPLAAALQGRAADRLHRRLDERFAGGGLHSAALYGRRGRAPLSRVRRHA